MKVSDSTMGLEALAIGNKRKKRHGVIVGELALKPPGPCPRCKDYKYWHWPKDCRALKCTKCNKIGHTSNKCPSRKRIKRGQGKTERGKQIGLKEINLVLRQNNNNNKSNQTNNKNKRK